METRLKIGNRRVLEKIIKLNGSCLHSELCYTCPFARECLMDFMNQTPKSAQTRVNMALDKLAQVELMDDDAD